jgi:hypothetical protein
VFTFDPAIEEPGDLKAPVRLHGRQRDPPHSEHVHDVLRGMKRAVLWIQWPWVNAPA